VKTKTLKISRRMRKPHSASPKELHATHLPWLSGFEVYFKWISSGFEADWLICS
jgi:hypothetical protein